MNDSTNDFLVENQGTEIKVGNAVLGNLQPESHPNRRGKPTFDNLRVSTIQKLIEGRHSGPCDTDDGLAYYDAVLPHLVRRKARGQIIGSILWAKRWTPRLCETHDAAWFAARETKAAIYLKADTLGGRLGVTQEEVTKFGLRTIGAVDRPHAQRKAERKNWDREYQRKRRKENGAHDVRGRPPSFTPEQRETVIQLVSQGVKVAEIARQTNLSRGTIYRIRNQNVQNSSAVRNSDVRNSSAPYVLNNHGDDELRTLSQLSKAACLSQADQAAESVHDGTIYALKSGGFCYVVGKGEMPERDNDNAADDFEERAAILEYDSGFPRLEAERLARILLEQGTQAFERELLSLEREAA